MQSKTKSLSQKWFTPLEIPSFHNSSIAKKSRRIKKIQKNNNSKSEGVNEQKWSVKLLLSRYLNPFPLMKTRLEIHFSLLGSIGISPFSFHYRVARMDLKQQRLIVISFEEIEKEKISWDTLFHILKQQNNEDSKKACSNIDTLTSMHERMTFHHINTMSDLEEVQKTDLPFQLTLYKVTAEGSSLYQLLINYKLLMLLGVTYEMLQNHIKETSAIPEPIYRNNYFKTWNQLFEATINCQRDIPIEVQTFEGARYGCDIQLKQFFIKGEDACWFAELCSFQINERLQKILFNFERIKKNRMSYFNLKDLPFQTEIETIEFQEATFQRQPMKNKNPCGYRQK